MLLAARNSFLVVGKPTARNYVQSGLVAMWDGIENAGCGQHDSSATSWKELTDHETAIPVNKTGLSWSNFGLNASSNFSSPPSITVSTGLYNAFFASILHGGGASLEWCWTCSEMIPPTPGGNPNKVLFGVQNGSNTNLGWCTFQYRSNDESHGFSGGPASAWNGAWKPLSRPLQYHTITTSKKGNAIDRYIALDGIDYGSVPLDNVSSTKLTTRALYLLPNISSAWTVKAICTIHCIRLYSRALTSSEIAANYAVDKERFEL